MRSLYCSRAHEDTNKDFKNLDSEMVAHITSKFREEISARIIEQWETACRKEESKSIEIYNNKQEDWIDGNVLSGFRNDHTNGSNVKVLGKPRRIRNKVNNRNSNAKDQAAEDQRRPFFRDFRGRSRSRNRRQNRGRGNSRNRTQRQGRQQSRGREENPDNSQQVRPTRRNEGIRNRKNTTQEEVIIPETQEIQVQTNPNSGLHNMDTQAKETESRITENIVSDQGGNDNFLYHAQGSTSTNNNNQLKTQE